MDIRVLFPAFGGLLLGMASAPTAAQLTSLFADGFESGNTLAWSASAGEPVLPPAEVFRLSDLDLRDPHLFVNLGVPFGCFDLTDQDLPLGLGPSFNNQLQAAITGDSQPDGLLDASYLLEFRPFDEAATGLRVDFGNGLCTAPIAGTSCAPDPAVLPQTAAYDGLAAGTCLAPLAGTVRPYTPAVASVAGPCFLSLARRVVFDLNGVTLPLGELQLAGEWSATPVSAFTGGLMRGFLSEAEAATVLLPASLPIVGGQPITILLPGGAGNCAGHDDRDLASGVSGWWFYFNFPGDAVLWTGN